MSKTFYEGHVANPEGDRPLVFAFHGSGGDETQFVSVVETLVPGAGLVSPRGDVSDKGVARFFVRTSDGLADLNDLAQRTERMTQYIAAMRDGFGPRPVYGFGYSNGADILASVFMHKPDLFDRVGLLHPLVQAPTGSEPDMQGRSVLVTAGEHDPIAPPERAAELVAWFEAQGADVSTHVHDGGHELRTSEIDALGRFFAD